MNRNRLVIRLVLLIAIVVIFFARGGQRNPQMLKTLGVALGVAVVAIGIRLAYESSKRKKAEQDRRLTAGSKDADLFTKPKDF